MMLQLADVFSSGMVLQREKPLKIWGVAAPEDIVTVSIQGKQNQTTASAEGNWEIQLPPLHASDSEELLVQTDREKLRMTDIAVGEVWVAGGQSNMEFQLCYEKHHGLEKDLSESRLRFYDVPEICYDGQERDFDYSQAGKWRKAERGDQMLFSAVGYYFQKELLADLQVPVGIIGCYWGGTRSCAWMNEETVSKVGKPWQDLFDQSTAGMDWDTYLLRQKENPMNDRGNPNMDPFSKMVLPATLPDEQVEMFFAGAKDSIQEAMNAANPNEKPGSLFQHMVLKIAGFSVRGVLWYQGESDDLPGLQSLYDRMLSGLITDWRTAWNEPSLPFLVVQLPGWSRWLWLHVNDFTTLRKCQEKVSDTMENVFLASISDVGEERDIHPKDKKTVGHRLALLARRHVYAENIVADAPRAEKAEARNGQICITFKNCGNALCLNGDSINALTLKCQGNSVDYTASVEGSQLLISIGRDIKGSISIEFAQEQWYVVNLFNEAGIPALPFRFELQMN